MLELFVFADSLVEVEHGHLIDLLASAFDPIVEVALNVIDVLVLLNLAFCIRHCWLFGQLFLVILAHPLMGVCQG